MRRRELITSDEYLKQAAESFILTNVPVKPARNKLYEWLKQYRDELLNSEQNDAVSDTTQDASSTGDGKQKEFPNIPLRIIDGL